MIDFQQFYWTKLELINFCRNTKLPTHGAKLDLAKRIEEFLISGKIPEPVLNNFLKKSTINKSKKRDLLSREAPVINYKSDLATREFFQKELGPEFRFNADVLVWIRTKLNNQESFTYGDIINEWATQNSLRKNPNHERKIPEQFQFNQFMKDWKNANAGPGAREAWNWIKALPGEPTYARYKEIIATLENTHHNPRPFI